MFRSRVSFQVDATGTLAAMLGAAALVGSRMVTELVTATPDTTGIGRARMDG